MRPAARLQAAIELLDEIIIAARDNGSAADSLARKFFAGRRYAGSKDRRAVRNLVWDAIRKFGERPANGRAAFAAMADADTELAALFDGSNYGPAALTSDEARATGGPLPKWMLPLLSVLVDETERAALLERAPLDIRVNVLKTTCDAVAAEMAEAERLPASPNAFRLPTGHPLDRHPMALSGAVEIQDLGSQLIVDVCGVKPGMTVLDICAGAGGKTLALAAGMKGQGRLIASDTNRNRLDQLGLRVARAGASGVTESRLLNPGKESSALAYLDDSCDVALIDAPCSGSGTWRRNPETRWRLSPARLERLISEQARLLDIAAILVRPGGCLVYAVCALTVGEGQQQISEFLTRHQRWQAEALEMPIGRKQGDGLLLTPAHDGTDGFFFARLRKL
ncbi:MAG: RsmB/NOP family class I SAM-dependent RNA methyltransferase [Sphingorhabdus sp.]